jgi:hypothetical protein
MVASRRSRIAAWSAVLAVAAVVTLGSTVWAQDAGGKKEKLFLEANAQGTSTQMGRLGTVQIMIDSFSTDAEREELIQAFQSGGHKGLYDAVEGMKSRGRIRVPGGLGYDINYVKEFQTPNGRMLRIVANRPIRMGEAMGNTRSMDYSLSVAEITFPAGGGKGEGVLIPAAEIKVENGELTVEAYQNPWKLTSVRER